MRIGDSPKDPVSSRNSVQQAQKTTAKGASSQTGSPASKQGAAPAESSELTAQLNEVPEIRAEVVAEIESRLEAGDLLTREAAEQTAQAILDQLHEEL